VGRTRLTVADIAALKGRRQPTMLRIITLDEAAAAKGGRNRHRLGPIGQ